MRFSRCLQTQQALSCSCEESPDWLAASTVCVCSCVLAFVSAVSPSSGLSFSFSFDICLFLEKEFPRPKPLLSYKVSVHGWVFVCALHELYPTSLRVFGCLFGLQIHRRVSRHKSMCGGKRDTRGSKSGGFKNFSGTVSAKFTCKLHDSEAAFSELSSQWRLYN